MPSPTISAYEQTRRRHFAYAMGLLPEYLARLRWSRAEIEAEQTRALRDLVARAATTSPWHRKRLRGVEVEHLTPDDLSPITPMTKDDLMASWDAIVTDRRCTLQAAETHLAALTSDSYFLNDLHVIASGGSSGKRGVFVYDWHGWAASWLGNARGLFAILMETQPMPTGPAATVSAYAATHATSAISQTFSPAERAMVRAPVTLPLAEIIEILNRTQPSVLHTYPSMLPPLCEAARDGRLQIVPALIWCSSEPLLPEARADAEATWRVPVLNGWAASESAGGSFSCTAGSGFHVGEDLNIIEPVDEDGRPVPRGERSAKILLTNLYNHVLPLIRYEITDEFKISPTPCACGSAYLKVEDVHGRADDVFDYGGGVRVHPLNFRSVLGKEPAILEYQVRQTQRGAQVDVVARCEIDRQAVARMLQERLGSLGVADPKVVVERVDAIDRQASGKMKRFIPLPP